MTESSLRWWEAEEGEVNKSVIAYVSEVERKQSYLFERFLRLRCLYDPYFAYLSGGDYYRDQGSRGSRYGGFTDGDVSENVIASTIDTVTSVVAAEEVRPRFMTDGADWSTQRRARHMEFYAEGLKKLLGVHDLSVSAFGDSALVGTGLAKVCADCDEIVVERVLVDDIIVDEGECRNGQMPRQMHQRVFCNKDVLVAMFPEHEDAIESASATVGNSGDRMWASYRAVESNQVVLIESWHLPRGKKGSAGYKPGRRIMCIDGTDLLDEEYHKPFFPFARMIWTRRASGWYGIGAAERIAGHQRRINKLNWQTDRQQDQLAVPTTYVTMADAGLAVKTTSRLGTLATYKDKPPVTVLPQAVSPETYARLVAVRESAFEEVGVSRLAATAKKPSGLDSGIALREYRDMTTQRFAQQEKAFEQFQLDVMLLVIDAAKDLGKRAPVVIKKSRFDERVIDWPKVDMGDVRVQIAAASTISRTPAGRMQMVLEWAQAGVITQDEARRLMQHPDLERSMSLYTAALDDIEKTIEQILDGEWLVPEPFQNLKMGVWRVQQAYLKARDDGAPEDILENLRQWIVQAAHVVAMQMEPEAAMPAPMAMPEQAAPTSAIAPEAVSQLAM